jgi:hypothetical protein
LVFARYGSGSNAAFAGGGAYTDNPGSVFSGLISITTTPISEALQKEYKDTERYPRDSAGLKEILKSHRLDFATALDPWELPYRAEFSVSGPNDVLTLVSNGPDKRPDTNDDFTVLSLQWLYFRPVGKSINDAVFAYKRETGAYIRDYATLRDVMKKRGIELDVLRDPWGGHTASRFQLPDRTTAFTSPAPAPMVSSILLKAHTHWTT